MSNAYYSVIEPASARRQFRLSIALVIAMAIGAFVLGFVTPNLRTQQTTVKDNGAAAFTGRLVSLIEQ